MGAKQKRVWLAVLSVVLTLAAVGGAGAAFENVWRLKPGLPFTVAAIVLPVLFGVGAYFNTRWWRAVAGSVAVLVGLLIIGFDLWWFAGVLLHTIEPQSTAYNAGMSAFLALAVGGGALAGGIMLLKSAMARPEPPEEEKDAYATSQEILDRLRNRGDPPVA